MYVGVIGCDVDVMVGLVSFRRFAVLSARQFELIGTSKYLAAGRRNETSHTVAFANVMVLLARVWAWVGAALGEWGVRLVLYS